MKPQPDTTLSQIHAHLLSEGYTENFGTNEKFIIGLKNKKQYKPEELVIEESHRFEGMTNPSDSQRIMAIKALDGTKGTLVMVHGAKHSQNTELIGQIKEV